MSFKNMGKTNFVRGEYQYSTNIQSVNIPQNTVPNPKFIFQKNGHNKNDKQNL